jgi:endonuclease IV
MNAPEFAAIPKVLETPKKEDLKEDVVNLGVLKSLIKS